MTIRCSFCGEPEGDNTTLLSGYDVCFDCIERMIENEQERRGVAREATTFSDYWKGLATGEDSERQQLKDAGRIA